MCELCKKADFALETVWSLLGANDVCDAVYAVTTAIGGGDHDTLLSEMERATVLKQIRDARTGDPKELDALRCFIIMHIVKEWIANCKCSARLASTLIMHGMQTGLSERLDK